MRPPIPPPPPTPWLNPSYYNTRNTRRRERREAVTFAIGYLAIMGAGIFLWIITGGR